MLEPALKSSPYFLVTKSQSYHPHFSKLNKTNECFVINRAFNSLSFRGKKGYPTNLLIKEKKPKQDKHPERSATYGAILCIRGQDPLYALVQGSYTGKWSFPKGHSNEGERPLDCTLREVAEETGIDELPEPSEYLQVGYGNYFIFNLTEQIPLIPRDTNEIMDTKWVTLKEMENMSLNADVSLYRKRLLHKNKI